MINKHLQNKLRWNEVTSVHAKSAFYDVPGFLAGKNHLDSIVLKGLGNLKGKSVLHLQCHFGLDTLAFARMGATVTGEDFSEASMAQAQELADQAKLSAQSRFICCDVLELDQHLDEKFDIVFTSYGVLTWLSDLTKWGQIVARFLKPDGFFFISEIHPVALIFDETSTDYKVGYDYFHNPAGIEIPPHPDYADNSFATSIAEYYWAWSLEDIFFALTSTGLKIREFKEYPFSCYKQFPDMTLQEDGFWHLPEGMFKVPLLFSLKATHS
jgi:2-polyprenyl-3-methyl-5-hydroxy-6-metoxy-1,4-benzoquinol methylase